MNDITYIPKHALYDYPAWGGDSASRWDRKHSMPFIIGPAVGAAAAAIGVAAAGATLATVGAAALATVAAVGAIATVAGLAMTVVGAITGNKSLMKIGGIVGIAGGIAGLGSMAISAGLNAASTSFAAATAAADVAQAASGATSGLSGITNAGAAFDAGKVAGTGLGQANALGAAGTEAFTQAAKGLTAQIKAAPVAAVGDSSSIPTTASVSATSTPSTATSSSFFDFLGKPTNNGSSLLGAGATVLGPAITGMATQSNADKAAETAANTLQYERDQAALRYNNVNDTANQMTYLTGTTSPGVAAVKNVAPITGNTVAGINAPTVVGGGLLAPLVPIDPLAPKKII